MDDIIVNPSREGNGSVDELDVRPNDSKVLDVLSENNSNYTFRGIMRKLGMHQESLSRSLQRLHDLDLIEKSQLGYKLSEKGAFLAKEDPKLKFQTPQFLKHMFH